MRIASLVPAATEALFALGFGDQVVAVTHECDHPAGALPLPRLTRSVLPPELDPGEVDARVREIIGRGDALYELDEPTLAAVHADVIVTQALCPVCAVSYDDVRAVAARLDSRPAVVSLDPKRLTDVLDDLIRLAEVCGDRDSGEALRARLASRLERLREAVGDAPRPRVLALEWLDPPYVGGHWVPEMIDAGGGASAAGEAGRDSRVAGWEELAATRPDVVIAMPCGLYVDEAAEQALAYGDRIEELGAERLVAVDAAGSFSRPGPRLVDGAELLGYLLHPERVAPPDGLGWRELAVAPGRA
jgi:iron complex transport system substrate-binding protein